jgi:hypothetical protein
LRNDRVSWARLADVRGYQMFCALLFERVSFCFVCRAFVLLDPTSNDDEDDDNNDARLP